MGSMACVLGFSVAIERSSPLPRPTTTHASLVCAHWPTNNSHGFGWGDDADVDSEILPLFYHLYDDVKYGGGYSGK